MSFNYATPKLVFSNEKQRCNHAAPRRKYACLVLSLSKAPLLKTYELRKRLRFYNKMMSVRLIQIQALAGAGTRAIICEQSSVASANKTFIRMCAEDASPPYENKFTKLFIFSSHLYFI